MNSPHSVLSELCFATAPLTTIDPLAAQATNQRSGFKLGGCKLVAEGSQRCTELNWPFFVRDIGPKHLDNAWDAFCDLLRRDGLPLFCTVEQLDGVAAAAVPPRWSCRFINEPLDSIELHTSDAFELSCFDRRYQACGWSSEIKPQCLPDWIRAVRAAAGGDTPIGTGLPLNCHADDAAACIAAGVDFITLSSRAERLEWIELQSLVACRQLTQQLGRPELPILVSAPLATIDEPCKLLALGASAVSLDSLLLPCIPKVQPQSQAASTSGGMLRGIATPVSRKPVALPEVRQRLDACKLTLRACMQRVGASQLMELNLHCLRGSSDRSLRLVSERQP